jgi:hypothetical protein
MQAKHVLGRSGPLLSHGRYESLLRQLCQIVSFHTRGMIGFPIVTGKGLTLNKPSIFILCNASTAIGDLNSQLSIETLDPILNLSKHYHKPIKMVHMV